MGRLLLLFFIFVPFIELVILIRVGQAIGFWSTVTLVVIMGLIGFIMVRSQGFRVIGRIRQELALGIPPGQTLLEGMFILIGGLLLIMPGLLTDIVGLLILIPLTRRQVIRILTPSLVNYFIRNTRHWYIRKW